MVLSNIYFKSLINHRVLRGGAEVTENGVSQPLVTLCILCYSVVSLNIDHKNFNFKSTAQKYNEMRRE